VNAIAALPTTNAVCTICERPFLRLNSLQIVCGVRCAIKAPRLERKRAKARDRARAEALKTRSDWMREAQAAVNRYVRLRDIRAGRGCITCGATPEQKRGGTTDAGHFRSVGSAPHLRFYLPQIALQCVTCNRYQGGRALDFRRALVARHGAEWVEWVEGLQGAAKWDTDYLRRLKAIFAKRARRIEKRMAYAE
jgi:hypothetical protein